MGQKQQHQVEFRLKKVSETGFFIDLEGLSAESLKGDLVKINFGFKIEFQDDNVLVIHFLVKYSYSLDGVERKLLEATSAHFFEIKDISEVIELKENKISDKANVLPALLGICIGTMRGIIVVKTAGSELANFPLPIVSPSDILKTRKK